LGRTNLVVRLKVFSLQHRHLPRVQRVQPLDPSTTIPLDVAVSIAPQACRYLAAFSVLKWRLPTIGLMLEDVIKWMIRRSLPPAVGLTPIEFQRQLGHTF